MTPFASLLLLCGAAACVAAGCNEPTETVDVPACPDGVVTAECRCGADVVEGAYCCGGVPQDAACALVPCGNGPVSASCTCGTTVVATGYCCSGLPTVTACDPTACEHGAVTSECVCGGETVSSGYCCSNVVSVVECTTVTDPCDPNPCQNDGTCIAEAEGYRCECAAGFIGPNCETPVSGTVYYIDADPAVGDDDTGLGTEAAPWRSLYKACESVQTAGDAIYVRAGVYPETAQCLLAEGVSIVGEGQDASLIDSTYGGDPAAIKLETWAGWEGVVGNQSISYLGMNGNLTSPSAIYVNFRSNVVLHHCAFVDFRDEGVRFLGQPGWYSGNPPTAWTTGNEVHHCTFTNNALSTGPDASWGNLVVGKQEGMRIHDNVITQTGRPPGENGFGVKFCDDGYNKSLKIYDNSITVAEYIADPKRYAFAIELWNAWSETEIYGNRIVGTIDIVNTDKLDGAYSVDIHDNEIGYDELQDQFERGILFEQQTTDVIVRSNTIKNVSYGINVHAFAGDIEFSNIAIYNNVLMNLGCTASADVMGVYFKKHEADAIHGTGTYIWHNTIVADPTQGSGYGIVLPPNSGTYSQCEVRNNIVLNWDLAPINGNGADPFDGLWIQHNVMVGNGNADDPEWTNGFSPTNALVDPAIKLDPLLVSSSDYHLQPGSPACGAGMNDAKFPTTDRDGTSYSTDPPRAIGAYECD